MMHFKIIAVLLLILTRAIDTKIYTNCEFAKDLVNDFSISQSDAAVWTCIAQHESKFDTDAINKLNSDGSYDYGILQINSRFWCSGGPGNPQNNNGCDIACSDLLNDNISNSVNCARLIYSKSGFNAWSTYQYCNGDVSSYTQGCF